MSYIISVGMGIFITLSKPASYRMWYQHLLSIWRLYEGRVYSVFSELAAHERRHNKDVLAQEICVVKATTPETKLPTPLVPLMLFTAEAETSSASMLTTTLAPQLSLSTKHPIIEFPGFVKMHV